MPTATDHTIEEPLNAVLRLRGDLRVERREFGGQPCYVIEDPLRAKFFRLGVAEYTFVALLDGTRSVQGAIRDSAGQLRERAFNECQALGMCRWLLETQLIETPQAVEHRRLAAKADKRQEPAAWLRNPLCVRLPLLDPRPALDRVESWLSWTLGKPFFIAWLAICCYAILIAAVHWKDLMSGTVVLLDRRHWWVLVASWLALKLLHETYHALVCRRFGGTASEAGIFVMFFAPVPYIDVTSSWRFVSKWQRIAVAAAGMYAEVFVAAIAIIVWANTGNAVTKHIAVSVAAMAGLSTLLVNANPLMRFDGYFILADWLEIPNLNMHGRRWLGSLVARLLGCTVAPLSLPPRAENIVKVYAVAAIVWRAIVWLTLLTGLLVLLARLHLMIAAVGGVLLVALAARPWSKSVGRWWRQLPSVSPRRVCTAAIAGVIAIAVGGYALLGPATVSAPGIVEYRPLVVVRAASAGFLRELHVRDGDTVQTGQKLVVLENRELLAALRLVELDIEKSVARCRMLRQAGETAAEQAERAQQAGLSKKRDELAAQVKELVVVAPAGGHIVGRNLETWLGRYVEAGTELFRIGDEAAKEVIIAIAQNDVELFQARGDAVLRVSIAGLNSPSLQAEHLAVEPRGTTRAPHEALSSRLGGPLAVFAYEDPTDSTSKPADELLDPCFKASLRLSAAQSRQVRAGQLAAIEFQTSGQTCGRRLLAQAQQWFRQQLSGAEPR